MGFGGGGRGGGRRGLGLGARVQGWVQSQGLGLRGKGRWVS